MDRIDKIKHLQENGIKIEKSQSLVINNFFTIITIAMVCLSMLYYTNFIVPSQIEKKKKEQKLIEHKKHLKERARQIALLHKLNDKK